MLQQYFLESYLVWQYPLMVIIFSLFVHENDVSVQFVEMIRFVAFKSVLFMGTGSVHWL